MIETYPHIEIINTVYLGHTPLFLAAKPKRRTKTKNTNPINMQEGTVLTIKLVLQGKGAATSLALKNSAEIKILEMLVLAHGFNKFFFKHCLESLKSCPIPNFSPMFREDLLHPTPVQDFGYSYLATIYVEPPFSSFNAAITASGLFLPSLSSVTKFETILS